MSLANGRTYLAIPGPSVMPERVLEKMHRAAPNIYGETMMAMSNSIWADLRVLAGTKHHVAGFIGNGHALWEAANANMFSRGDKVLVLATGRFGVGWAAAARAQGIDAELMDFGLRAPVDMARVEARLRADKAGEIKAILTTQVDTATSIRTDIAALRRAIDATGHDALFAVDCIASLGCEEFHMDAWGVDVMIAASQKGLMTPPGIGFVWYSDKALDRCRNADLRTPYWSWTSRAGASEAWEMWGGTPPTHHLFGLQEALRMIVHEEGVEAVWARHAALARTVWAAFDAWGGGNPEIAMNVVNPADRAHAVTAARMGAPHATRLRQWCEAKAGVTLGIGIGMVAPGDPAADGFLRVAHMGHVNAHMTLGVLAVIEAGMIALDIPHGSGGILAAAAEVAKLA